MWTAINMIKKISFIIVFLFINFSLGYGFRFENNNNFIDDGDRRITVRQQYYKIVSLYPAHTENLFALGAINRLVGIAKSDTYPPVILSKPKFSYHFGIERFLKVRPDLILIRPMIDRGYKNLITQLEKQNITVVSIQPKNIHELYDYWKILGLLIGNVELADNMIDDFRFMLSMFYKINNNIKHKKKVFFESIHRKVKTFCKDSISAFVLEMAGGINVAEDAHCIKNTNIAEYGKERLFAKGDKIDVYLVQKGRMNNIDISNIKYESGFNIIRAVKHNHIYEVDEEITSRPTLRLLLGIYEVGHILYPDYYDNKIKEQVLSIINKYYQK